MERYVPLVAWAVLATLLAVGAASVGANGPARADLTAPENGKIAFRTFDGIETVNPDGSARQVLVPGDTASGVSWSPDGSRFVFSVNQALYVADADGTDRTLLSSIPCGAFEPAWSPDGGKIAYQGCYVGEPVRFPGGDELHPIHVDIYTVNADGTARTNLTNDEDQSEDAPAWSPDGSRIAYELGNTVDGEIRVMNADGTGQGSLPTPVSGRHPAWSPDGDKIAFSTGGEIKTVNPDGSGVQTLTDPDGAFVVANPAFSPDGTKVAFEASRPSCPNCSPSSYPAPDIYAMSFDGTEQAISRWTNLTNTEDVREFAPAWQPNSAPQVEPLRPSPGATTADRTPRIKAGVTDAQSDLAKGDITLRLDGRTVPRKAFDYDRGTDRLYYVPGDRLAHGRHTARVEAEDGVGLVTTERWSFRVVR